MRTDLSRNYVLGPKLAFCLGWHRAAFILPGNLALDFKQMHPEGLVPERVWYDLCSAFSHNPENFRAKRHSFSLFSICCELYESQRYFSVNLNSPGPLSTSSSEVLPLRVCYMMRNRWPLRSESTLTKLQLEGGIAALLSSSDDRMSATEFCSYQKIYCLIQFRCNHPA